MTTRYAIYYAPEPDDPLWRAGCDWLGRDPTGGAVGPAPDIPDIGALTADPRGYGFHATLKSPMRLRDGVTRQELLDATVALAATIPAFEVPPLAVADFDGFLCLLQIRESAGLQAVCDLAVAALDPLRAPPSDAEFSRRRAAGLSPVREANLMRWGYPDVFATWTFHMTLSRRTTPEQMAVMRPAAEKWFEPSLSTRRQVRDLCLFEQADGGSFRLTERVRLAADTSRVAAD